MGVIRLEVLGLNVLILNVLVLNSCAGEITEKIKFSVFHETLLNATQFLEHPVIDDGSSGCETIWLTNLSTLIAKQCGAREDKFVKPTLCIFSIWRNKSWS